MNLGVEFPIHLVIFSFHVASNLFFSIMCTRLGFFQRTSCDMAYYICDQTINSIGEPFFSGFLWGKCIITHDDRLGFFVFIAIDVKFHILHEQTCVPITLLVFMSQVNIVFTTNGFAFYLISTLSIPFEQV